MAETDTNSGAKLVLFAGAALIAVAVGGGIWVSQQPDQEAAMRRLMALALGDAAPGGTGGDRAQAAPLWQVLPAPAAAWSRTDYLGAERAAEALVAAGATPPATPPDDAAAAVYGDGQASFTLYLARGGAAPAAADGPGATIAGIAFDGAAGPPADLLAAGGGLHLRILGAAPAEVLEPLLSEPGIAALPFD